jgi:hypothetical protein
MIKEWTEVQALHDYVSYPAIQLHKPLNASESSNMKFIYRVRLKYEADYTMYILPPATNSNSYKQDIIPLSVANFNKGGTFYAQKAPHTSCIH